ncbi:MAG: hypothetical protein ACKPBV_17345, partial [Sphaerospermopsis kisseleviana]
RAAAEILSRGRVECIVEVAGLLLRKFHTKGIVGDGVRRHHFDRHDGPQTNVTHRKRWCFSRTRAIAPHQFRLEAIFGTKRAVFNCQL